MDNRFPEGKYMATVKVGPKGQIVIPKEVRDMFGIGQGSALILLADKGQGIAIQPFSYAETLWNSISKLREEGRDD